MTEAGSAPGPGEVDGGEIPARDLPPGFLETLGQEPDPPVPPRPAATLVLLREGRGGTEVLLLRRARTSGFVPGAWVFPGGTVDREDSDPRAVDRVEGLTPAGAEARLDLRGGTPPAIAYYLTAVREAFEETGFWPGPDGGPDPRAPEVARVRGALLAGEARFAEVMDELGLTVPGRALEYVAHWITPEVEPRRYDTRFFAAVVPGDREALTDPREMTGALWLPAARALEAHRRGELPMVFPTVHTLESLKGRVAPEELLARFRGRPIPRILPRLVRTSGGVALRIPVPPDSSPP